jgi:capsular polysaccharide transport system permease protein
VAEWSAGADHSATPHNRVLGAVPHAFGLECVAAFVRPTGLPNPSLKESAENMTVLESTDRGEGGTKEPIRFPATKEERREERLRRRGERKRNLDEPETGLVIDPDEFVFPVEPQVEAEAETKPKLRHRLQISWIFASFLLMVVVPGVIGGLYYAFIASPIYVVETQFSVRGSNQASMASFGLSGLFGSSVQSGDSYIVSSYITSEQLVRDVKEQLGIDLRQYYSKNDIDLLYRINPATPLEKFGSYWNNMVEVSFNSTTGNTTFYVFAFSPDDAKAISDIVLKVSEKLVNDLSEKNRIQMTQMATKQVERSEDRLRKVSEQLRTLRSQVQIIDPQILVKGNAELTQKLQDSLQELKTRQSALLESVDKDSPSARMLQKQIKATETQIRMQKSKIGETVPANTPADDQATGNRNVAGVVEKFEALTIEQEFATKAYTTSLAAMEASLSEAQKQERYFATFVAPARPEIALYPQRLLDTFILVLVLMAVWMISQFLYRSFRDHAI